MKYPQQTPLFPSQTRLLHGGDYNPEQWPAEIVAQDADLMDQANVNSVTLGVFSWCALEPSEGVFDFDWLDRVMDSQYHRGRYVGLATPTAAVPAWMGTKYPEILRVNPDGLRNRHGNRVNTSYASKVFQEKAAIIVSKLAERYTGHPALAFWHISNEYGGCCYGPESIMAFREWLEHKYETLENLNRCWWTEFWSHRYTEWDQIFPPGAPLGETSIHGLTLDWKRFCSDQIISFLAMERDILKSHGPDIPVTTNLMGTYAGVDGFKISKHLDFVSWDSYPWFHGKPSEVDGWIRTAFHHDLNRSMGDGRPFLLMECTPSSSNWYPTMKLKRPGQHTLEGLQAVAHGSDGVQYFQWRQSAGSLEQFHGAVVGHNNRSDARVFCDVKELGAKLNQLDGLVGGWVHTKVAIVFDWEVLWAIQTCLEYRSKTPQYTETILSFYRSLFDINIAVDIVDSTSDLSEYKLVIAPMLFMLRNGIEQRLASFVSNGGCLVTTYLSGWVDDTTKAYLGGIPEPLRSVLGVVPEEWDELYLDETNTILWDKRQFTSTTYSERVLNVSATVLATFENDFYAGEPALTVNQYGSGKAYYIASRNEAAFTSTLMQHLVTEHGIVPNAKASHPAGVSIRTRNTPIETYFFVLNYANTAAEISLEEPYLQDAFTGEPATVQITLEAFGSRVFRKPLMDAQTP
jgi:beta-galactosidase